MTYRPLSIWIFLIFTLFLFISLRRFYIEFLIFYYFFLLCLIWRVSNFFKEYFGFFGFFFYFFGVFFFCLIEFLCKVLFINFILKVLKNMEITSMFQYFWMTSMVELVDTINSKFIVK